MPQDLDTQLRTACRSSGLIQSALASKSGLTQGYISMWLKGRRRLTLENAAAIARAVGQRLTLVKK